MPLPTYASKGLLWSTQQYKRSSFFYVAGGPQPRRVRHRIPRGRLPSRVVRARCALTRLGSDKGEEHPAATGACDTDKARTASSLQFCVDQSGRVVAAVLRSMKTLQTITWFGMCQLSIDLRRSGTVRNCIRTGDAKLASQGVFGSKGFTVKRGTLRL